LTDQEQGPTVITYYILVEQMFGFAIPFPNLSKLGKSVGQAPFYPTKLAYFDFLSSNFIVQGHVECIGGDALNSGV